MIRKCCICGKVYGRKKPFEDKSVTHGYCGPCTLAELEKLDKYMQGKNKKEASK